MLIACLTFGRSRVEEYAVRPADVPGKNSGDRGRRGVAKQLPMPRSQASIVDSRSQSNAADSVAGKSIRPEESLVISTEQTGDDGSRLSTLSSSTSPAPATSTLMATKHCEIH